MATLAAIVPARATVFSPETFTLENGLQVVVISNHRAPIVSHMMWYRVGSADDPPGSSGIAHFLEHLMFKGTETLAPGEFSKIVAANGGRENAFTSYDYTGYYQNVAVDRLETVMRIEADRMNNLVLTDEIVAPERDVVLEERRSRTDNNPGSILGEASRASFYQNHPYGNPIIGWAHEIAKLTARNAIDFYRRHYAPNNAILVIAGDVTAAQIRPLAEKYYGAIARRDLPPRTRPREPEHRAALRIELRDSRVRQPSWSRSYLAPVYGGEGGEHAYALQVLAQIAGNGASSRLHQALVVGGKLATSAGADYDSLRLDRSSFSVYASPRPGVTLDRIEAAMDAEIAKLLTGGVEEEEVERAKQRLRRAAIFARDSLSTGARIIGMALTTGRTVDDVEAWPDRIGAVTVDQVNAAAKAVLRRQSSITAQLLPEAPEVPKAKVSQ
jgi:zinc protease